MPNILTVGLGNGDEGKGTIVDFLVRHWGLRAVVRYNGGSQPAHNVVAPDGTHHCFAQVSSGGLIPGVKTLLSCFMLIDPLAFLEEEDVLRKKTPWNTSKLVYISKNCPIITPFHIAVNQLQESYRIHLGNPRGSCGKGVTEAFNDAREYGEQYLYAGDLLDVKKTASKLYFLRALKMDKFEQIPSVEKVDERAHEYLLLREFMDTDPRELAMFYRDFAQRVNIIDDEFILEEIHKGDVVFEGAQGALLDPRYGFSPHVTATNTTLENAEELLKQSGYSGDVRRIGILRGYATRHGAGPFITEDPTLSERIPPCHNKRNIFQGKFRLGWFDAVASRYALKVVGGIDYLAITNLDRLKGLDVLNIATSYRIGERSICDLDNLSEINVAKPFYDSLTRIPSNPDWGNLRYIKHIETLLGKKVGIVSFGPTANDKKFI